MTRWFVIVLCQLVSAVITPFCSILGVDPNPGWRRKHLISSISLYHAQKRLSDIAQRALANSKEAGLFLAEPADVGGRAWG